MNQGIISESPFPLSRLKQGLLAALAFMVVAFGQPAWLFWLAPLAAVLGYALFWRVLLCHPSRMRRFWLAAAWFTGVQLVQLSWFISHPYAYIYAVYFLLSLWLGVQFGLVAIFITPSAFRNIRHLLAIAGLWTVLEWSRLLVLSGLSWNPAGIAMTGNIYSLQAASLAGVFGLSFWVCFVNLLALRAYMARKANASWVIAFGTWLCALLLPYLYGLAQLTFHAPRMATDQRPAIKAVLVQTAFGAEESEAHTIKKNPVDDVIDQWRQILHITKKHAGESFDLLVMPEFVVPFGTYAFAYPLQNVHRAFYEIFGPESLKTLPSLEYPLSIFQKTSHGPQIMVNNAYWVQGLANYFKAGVVVGLEDAEDITMYERQYYSAALFFPPQSPAAEEAVFNFPARYEKRILVPMGEYIPFACCRELAARYGVAGSFTCGSEAKVLSHKHILFSPSICYEETFGDVMRESRQKGSELLVNLTSDVWYPNSRLPRQHFDHARLRTVENGIPLIRACNTGVTGAIDSLGQIIAVLGGDKPEEVEWIPDSLLVEVPAYNYETFYAQVGDKFIIGLCCLAIVFSLGSLAFAFIKK